MRVLVFLLAAAPLSANSLIDAARNDDRGAVEALLKQTGGINAREDDGTTALAWAAMRGNVEIAALLLKAGADPNLTSATGIGPLSLAISNGSKPLVRLLTENGADPNIARENGETPLMTAARFGQIEMMKTLLSHGAKVNARETKFGQTALMWAAGHPHAVRLLLEYGADPRAVTKTWDVKYTIYAPTTVTLGKTGIPWNTDGEYTSKKGGQNALFFAVQQHDMESARALLDAGIDVNAPSADGSTPLLASLYAWDPPRTVFIPGKGAPAPAGTSQKFSPDLAMARLLLDRGAKATAADGAGYTPLHAAALAVANASIGKEFRRGGAYGRNAALLSLGAGGDKGGTAEEGLAIVKALLDAGADPNRQTLYPTPGPAGDVRINPAPPGSSALHIAAGSTNVDLVRMLADRGANPNLVRKDGHTPFSVSVMAGNLDVVKEMLARGADLHARFNPADKIPDPVEAITLPRENQTILHIAALGGSAPIIEYLYQKGAKLDLKNSMGETPLDLADHQERYREAIQRQGAEGDPEKLKKIVRQTATTDAIKKLLPAR